MSDLLVLHDVGEEEAGAPWRAAFADWPGRVLAPDLPGHGTAAAPVGGCYEMADAVLLALRTLRSAGVEPDEAERGLVVVGVGVSGWAAQMLALGGRARGLALVDGLGGPWQEPHEIIAAGVAHLRLLADDPAAQAPPPADGLDPRLRHGIGGQNSRRYALRAAAGVPVPTLLLESPASRLDGRDRQEVVAAFTAPVSVVEIPNRTPAGVAEAVAGWAAELDSSSAA